MDKSNVTNSGNRDTGNSGNGNRNEWAFLLLRIVSVSLVVIVVVAALIRAWVTPWEIDANFNGFLTAILTFVAVVFGVATYQIQKGNN